MKRRLISMPRLLIADENAGLRQDLKRLLAAAFPAARFGEAGGLAELETAVQRDSWDILIFQRGLWTSGGFSELGEFRQRFPRLPVLLRSPALEPQMALRAIRAGAAGCVDTAVERKELVTAVTAILGGSHYVSPALLEQLPAGFRRTVQRPRRDALSEREQQVCQLSVAGRSIRDIAAELGVSPKTVITFRSRLFSKLGLRGDEELIRYAREHGFT